MAVWHKRIDVRKKKREAAAVSAASILFVSLAESGGTFDVTTLGEHAALFDRWVKGIPYSAGQIRRDETDGSLYRCLTAHGAEHATAPPSESPTLWGRIVNPADEWPEWFPYTGVADAWMTGSKCSHSGGKWVSAVDYNVWEPGVAAVWDEVREATPDPDPETEQEPDCPRWADLEDGHSFAVGDVFTDYGKTYVVLRAFSKQANWRPPALIDDFYKIV